MNWTDWNPDPRRNWLVLIPLAAAAGAALVWGATALFRPRPLLLWFWLASSITGLLAFDLLNGTHSVLQPRYALPGMPAAFLLGGLLFSCVPRRAAAILLVVLVIGCISPIRGMHRSAPRPGQPFPEIAAHLDAHTTPSDLIVVRSIPSGVVGVARYMRSDTPVASWVEQLHTDGSTRDLDRLTRGACQIAVVGIHTVTAGNAVDPWLRANARLVATRAVGNTPILYFRRDPPAGLSMDRCRHVPAAVAASE